MLNTSGWQTFKKNEVCAPFLITIYLNLYIMSLTRYCSGDKIKKNEMGVIYSAYGGGKRVLVGKPEGKTPLSRPRHRREDNIKMDLQEVGCWEYGLDRPSSG